MIKQTLNSVRALLVLLFLTMSISVSAEEDIAGLMEERLQSLLKVIAAEHTESDLDAELQKTVDYAAITRGVLGKHGKELTPEQVSRFQTEFEKSMNGLLVSALSSIGEFDLEIGEVKKRNEERAQVFAVVTTEKSERFEIVSSIAKESDDWLVRNLIVNGVNLGLTYRNQFNALVTDLGDPVKAIDAWAETVNNAFEAASS